MTHLDDVDIVARLRALAADIPLPATTPDDDLRYGRRRVRRNQVAALSAVAAVVAVVIGTSFAVRGIVGSGATIPPAHTPAPGPTVTAPAHPRSAAGPARVLAVYAAGDGFFAQDVDLRIWHRDANGWQRLYRAHASGLTTSANDQDLLTERGITHDGGRTWQQLREPQAPCVGSTVLLTTGTFTTAGPCASGAPSPGSAARWRGYWQPTGSEAWQERAAVDSTTPWMVDRVGDILIARSYAPDSDVVTRVVVSRDAGLSWQEIPYPCSRRPQTDSYWPKVEVGVAYAQCRDDQGAQVVFTLGDDGGWDPAVTLPENSRGVLPVGAGGWLVSTSTGDVVIGPDGSTPVDLPWDRAGDAFEGIATAGTDVFIAIGRGDGVPLFVSHDGGRTWQRDRS